MSRAEVQDRSFESFRMGEEAAIVREISQEDIGLFSRLSGDRNPLHVDEGYASKTAYGKPLAHGLLVAAPLSALAGHWLPGRRGLLLQVRVCFVHPVFSGDRLIYRAKVAHISEATKVIKVGVEATNQDGVLVLEGSYEAQVRLTAEASG